MKISWGIRILFLYLGFAGLIIFLVASSMNEKIDLVTPDYYEKELVYQYKKESIERNNNLKEPVMIYWNKDGILIQYPSHFNIQDVSGSINIFRPSDKNLDFSVDISPSSEYQQIIPSNRLKTGMYRVTVSYNYNNLDYIAEKQIVVR